MSCAVEACLNVRRFKHDGISFHQFPRSPRRLETWLNVIGKKKDNFSWTKNKVICSQHFSPSDYIDHCGKKVLKLSAVPSQFLSSNEGNPGTSSSKETSTLSSCVQSENLKKSIKRKLSCSSANSSKLESSTGSSDSSATKRNKISHIRSIHNYSLSPSKIQLQNIGLKQSQVVYRKKLYKAKQRIIKLTKKVNSLEMVINHLKQQNLVSENVLDHLGKTFEGIPQLLISRYLKNVQNKSATRESYPAVLREFAATLQFYSCRAYEYVRKVFALALPNQSTIRKWYSNIDCSPGYITSAFNALKIKVDEMKMLKKEVICFLMLDEMSIKKQVEFDGKKVWGYVDIGIPIENDDLSPATEALVVMVVAHQASWKVPIAYFFIKSLTGKDKANIVKECLVRLHEIGVQITSLTCDGPSSNVTMIKDLGCVLEDVHNMKTWFAHPSDESRIRCILDVCHMLKLFRNNLASLGQILDPEGRSICWKYLIELYNLQEQENFAFGNKLRRSHIEWYKQKMKVNLAAQTLSTSVADAIDFLNVDQKLLQFRGSEKHKFSCPTITKQF